jgi:hypothetical protein
MKPIMIFFISITCIQTLGSQNKQGSQIIDINILKSLDEKETVRLSRFVEEVSYIISVHLNIIYFQLYTILVL